MKIRFLLLLLLAGISCFSQSRDAVIDSVMQKYPLSSFMRDIYLPMAQSKLMANITERLTGTDLDAMSQSDNRDWQIYAQSVGIATGRYRADTLFQQAYTSKKDSVGYISCSYTTMPLHSFWYTLYETKLWEEAQAKYSNTDEALEYNKKVNATDSQLMAMDSIILMNERHPYMNSYCDVLENRKYPDTFLPRIEHLAFKENFACAIAYLQSHYPDIYLKRIDHYWRKDFPKADFVNFDDFMSLRELLYMLLNSSDNELKKVAAHKIDSIKVTSNNKHWIKEFKELIRIKS